MKNKQFHALYVIIITSLLVGCSSPSSSNGGANTSPENYIIEIVNLTEPIYESIRTESIDQPNCTGTGEVDNIIERTMGINHAIELGLGLTTKVDGSLELLGTGVNLGAEIASELGYQYGIIESISRSIVLRAAPKSHVIHKVNLSEIWESGTAKVTVNNQSMDIPFRFRADFSIDLLESIPVDCISGEPLPPPVSSETGCQLPIRGTYNFSRSNVVFNLGPGTYTFYAEAGAGQYGYDVASCELNSDCTQLRAINKDSADSSQQGVISPWVDTQSEVATARWNDFVVTCSLATTP